MPAIVPLQTARKIRRLASPPPLAALALVLGLGLAGGQAQASGAYLELGSRTSQPSGAAGLCQRYGWACSNAYTTVSLNRAAFSEIAEINLRINKSVRSVSDRQQYGVSDHWTYPANGAGDCEDFALAKKRALMALGLPGNRLLLATVHSPRVGPHAVLVLRLDDGDYVLDNLTDRILPWHATGYAFLRIQSPTEPGVWRTGFANRS
jgi:predicted transglutaminase-like cysteine proteinase